MPALQDVPSQVKRCPLGRAKRAWQCHVTTAELCEKGNKEMHEATLVEGAAWDGGLCYPLFPWFKHLNCSDQGKAGPFPTWGAASSAERETSGYKAQETDDSKRS